MQNCQEGDANAGTFVQAVLLDSSGNLSVYDPLVINYGTTPLAAPVTPVLGTGAVVGIWVGGNDNISNLVGPGQQECTNGLKGSEFGQVAFCGTQAFWTQAQSEFTAGTLKIPALGTDSHGDPCPTVRSFKVADQDPSDNVQTTYLFDAATGQTGQNTSAVKTAFPSTSTLVNPSDNRVLTEKVDPAVGCTPWKVADEVTGKMTGAQALDELQAGAYQATPIATVPLGDPMTLYHGAESVTKTNLYRAGVDQPPVGTSAPGDDTYYCTNEVNIAPPFLKLHESELMALSSPVPSVANNLFTFLANRFVGTYEQLLHVNCVSQINTADPVKVTYTNGIATGATVS
jgi:hypothetical protein